MGWPWLGKVELVQGVRQMVSCWGSPAGASISMVEFIVQDETQANSEFLTLFFPPSAAHKGARLTACH